MLNHNDKVKTLNFIRPDAEFILSGDELQWLDSIQAKPTEAEIESGWIAYQAKIETDKVAAQAQKQAILDRLGLTEDELRIVLS